MHNKKSAKLQKLPFTDEQICSRAYQISQKYPERSPDENWLLAIQELEIESHWWKRLKRWTGFGEKKGWDIFQLLFTALIPLFLFGATQHFSTKNNEQQKQAATDKAQQETLVKYFDQMSEAIKTDNLLSTKPDKKAFIIAQIRTITALQSLNPDKQRAIIQFLRTTDLLNPSVSRMEALTKKPKMFSHGLFYRAHMSAINLNSSDLTDADLSETDLSEANLSNAELSGAYLRFTNLRSTNLSGAYLNNANLSNVDLSKANLSNTHLNNADLSNADLSNADLSNANLTRMRNFSAKQIKSAKNLASATHNGKRLDNPEVFKQLGLNAKP
jgi:uncharacterized protein YjbI with pentapeptide repeats